MMEFFSREKSCPRRAIREFQGKKCAVRRDVQPPFSAKARLRKSPCIAQYAAQRRLDHDAIERNRINISSLCLSMIFSENRFPLFRIML
jgi:hypothetical protein